MFIKVKSSLFAISILTLTGCTSVELYPISGNYAKIKEKQILDPMAPVNNEGIVNSLEGNYGKKVVESYQKSSTAPSEGRQAENANQILSSSSSSGGSN